MGKKNKGMKSPQIQNSPGSKPQETFQGKKKRSNEGEITQSISPKKMKIDVVSSFTPTKPAFKSNQNNKKADLPQNQPNANPEGQPKKKKKKKRNKNKKTNTSSPNKPTPSETQRENKTKKNKNRAQRLQAQLNDRERTTEDCMKALEAEKKLNATVGRIFKVHIPDPEISLEIIKGWSPAIQNALFPTSIEPRSFLVVFKNKCNISQEKSKLEKVKIGGKNLTIDEHSVVGDTKKSSEFNEAALVDPYSLYVTNLPSSVTRADIKAIFPESTLVMNPRRHKPKLSKAKFTFVSFSTPQAALKAFKENFNKTVKCKEEGDFSIVIRFRRVGHTVPVGVKEPVSVEKAETKTETITEPKNKGKKVQSSSAVVVAPQKTGNKKEQQKKKSLIEKEVEEKLNQLKKDPNDDDTSEDEEIMGPDSPDSEDDDDDEEEIEGDSDEDDSD